MNGAQERTTVSANENFCSKDLEAEAREVIRNVMTPPEAAYSLGYHVYPLYPWMPPEKLCPYKADVCPWEAADLSRDAITVLANELHPNVHSELLSAWPSNAVGSVPAPWGSPFATLGGNSYLRSPQRR